MKVLIATNMYPNKDEPNSDIYIKKQVELLNDNYDINCLIVTGGGGNNNNNIFNKAKKLLIFTIRLIYNSLFFNFDLIHAHFAYPTGFLTLIAKLISQKKMVLTIHGSDINELEQKNSFKFLLTKFTLNNVNKIIAVSNNLKKKTVNKFNIPDNKISVIDMGYDPKLFYPKSYHNLEYSSKLKFLFVGRLVPIKGLDILIKAFSKINSLQKNLNYECSIIGDGFQKMNYKKYITTLSLSDRVKFLGYKTQIEIGKMMREADFVIIPSLKEGFGLVAIESLACGTPIICSETGGLKDIVINKKNGFIFPPGDYKKLSEILISLINNKLIINIDNCIKTSSAYKINDKVNQINTLYHNLKEY